MKKVIYMMALIACTLVVPTKVQAGNLEVREDMLGRTQILEHGNVVATAKMANSGETRFYSEAREYIGRAVRTGTYETSYFDKEGVFAGRANDDGAGTVTYYDATGKLIGSCASKAAGPLMFFDVVVRKAAGSLRRHHQVALPNMLL